MRAAGVSNDRTMAYPLQLLDFMADVTSAETAPTTTLTGTTAVMPDVGGATHIYLQFMQVTNAAATVQLADNSSSATVVVAVQRATAPDTGTPMTIAYNDTHQLDEPLMVAVPPGHTFGVYITSTVTSPAAGAQRLNIYWTPIRKEA